MRRVSALGLLLSISGCALPTSVQRIGVDYNHAVANLTDELALTNVLRANRGYTLHYTSLSRLTGSITLKMTGGFNAQLKASAPTNTSSTVTTTAPSGVTVADTVTRAVASGGSQYTPSIGGEVDTNPSFDVDVNDTQEFYQGMLTGIEPTLIDDLIRQGYDQRELLGLVVSDVNFTLKEDAPQLAMRKGESILRLRNLRGDLDLPNDATAPTKDQFASLFGCYAFQTSEQKSEPKVLAPLSRIGGSNPGSPQRFTLQDLALLDGAKLDVSKAIRPDPASDRDVDVVRPATKTVAGKIAWNDDAVPNSCTLRPRHDPAFGQRVVYLPAVPPPGRLFVGNSLLFTAVPGPKPAYTYVGVDIAMTIRSPEAVIQFVGDCLGDTRGADTATCTVGGVKVFEIERGRGGVNDVTAQFGDERFHINASTEGGRASLRTLGLIEKLIDLHKSSTDKPVTQPVRIVS